MKQIRKDKNLQLLTLNQQFFFPITELQFVCFVINIKIYEAIK